MRNIKRVLDLYPRGRVIGELVTYEETIKELKGYLRPQDNLKDNRSALVGIRILGEEYIRDFIIYRASDRSRPQLEQRVAEAGIKEYDELVLFLYASGRCCMDTYMVKPKKKD